MLKFAEKWLIQLENNCFSKTTIWHTEVLLAPHSHENVNTWKLSGIGNSSLWFVLGWWSIVCSNNCQFDAVDSQPQNIWTLETQNMMVKPYQCSESHSQGHVKMSYRCVKLNAYCLLRCRENWTLIFSPLLAHCDLALRSRSSKWAWAYTYFNNATLTCSFIVMHHEAVTWHYINLNFFLLLLYMPCTSLPPCQVWRL